MAMTVCLLAGTLTPAIRAMNDLLELFRRGARKAAQYIEKCPFRSITDRNPSTLPLLVPRVGADDADHAGAPHDLAVAADFLDGSSDFHVATLLISSADRAGPAEGLQIGLLEHTFILVAHQVRLQLGHEIHDHDHGDQQRSAA